MKRNIVKATVLLAVGGFIGKALGAFYRIPLSNILGAEGMGVYQLIFPLYTFALIFISGGLPLAIAKFTSSALAKREYGKIAVFFYGAIFFSIFLGLIFVLLFFLLAKQIAILQNIENLYYGYYLIGISVFFASFIACFRGLFQGYNNMFPTFMSSLFEQIFKLVLGLILAYSLSVYSINYAVLGALLGITLTEIITFLYLLVYTLISKHKKKIHLYLMLADKKERWKETKSLLIYSVPITLSSILLPLTFALQTLISINLLVKYGHSESYATSLFGVQTGMINSIINFPSVISVAFATTIVPSLTYYVTKKDRVNSHKLIGDIYRIIWILILPCVVGIFVLSEPIIKIAFAFALEDNLLDIANLLMKLSSFSIIFISFTQISTVLLQTLQQQWKAFLSLFVFFVINIIVAISYIEKFSIIGLCLANIISYASCSVLNMFFLSKKYSPSLLIKEILLPLFFAILMGIIINYLFAFLPINSIIIKLLICILFAIIFYFSNLILFKIINLKKLLIKRKIQQK